MDLSPAQPADFEDHLVRLIRNAKPSTFRSRLAAYYLKPPHHPLTTSQILDGGDVLDFIEALYSFGFTSIFVSDKNSKLDDLQRRIEQNLKYIVHERFRSKAWNLAQSLESIGIKDFKCVYKEHPSPYGPAVMHRSSTLEKLRSALDTAGFAELDHWAFFEEEYDQFRPEPFDPGLNVGLYTVSAFEPLLGANRRPWFERLGQVQSYRTVLSDRDDSIRRVPVKNPKLAVVYYECDVREFDDCRVVLPENIEKLRGGPYMLTETDGVTFELRPRDLGQPLTERLILAGTTRTDEAKVIFYSRFGVSAQAAKVRLGSPWYHIRDAKKGAAAP